MEESKVKIKTDWRYNIFYAVAIAGIAVISLLGNSYFAYEIFNSALFDIVYLLLIVALFIVRSIQTYFRQKAVFGKVFALSYFNMFAVVFTVKPFVDRRIWAVFLLLSGIIAVVLLVALAFKRLKSPAGYKITRFEPIIAMIPLLLLLMIGTLQIEVAGTGKWIPTVISGAILAATVLAVFFKFFRKTEYFQKRKSEVFAAVILLAALSFGIAFTAIDAVNYAFDRDPVAASFQIIDKRIQSGSEQTTLHLFKVQIDGKDKEIAVPIEVYFATPIGENVEIQFYNGALGYGYYLYE